MIRKLRRYVSFLGKLNVIQFFYLNYFCKNVIRLDKSRIIPYKYAVINLEEESKIYLCNGDLEIGCDSLRGSKTETRVRLRKNSVWSLQGGCKLSYGVTLEVLSNALLDSKFFTMNSNSVIIAAEKISLGQDVMIARNVIIYDSDFHTILDEKGRIVNYARPIMIGNHVWIGTGVKILKGAIIGSGSIIGAGSVITNEIEENVIYRTDNKTGIKTISYGWERKAPTSYEGRIIKK